MGLSGFFLTFYAMNLELPLAFSYNGDDASKCSRQPEVLWAQRSDRVYLTISLPDAKDVSVKCEQQGSFSFSAVGVQGESFSFSLQLYGAIVAEVGLHAI